jgi:tRNA pseudouridine38-40 synthase
LNAIRESLDRHFPFFLILSGYRSITFIKPYCRAEKANRLGAENRENGMRIKLIVEYDGTGYVGWQRQRDLPSVQEAMERAFEQAVGERVVIHGSGRTDAGVHAEALVAHFDTQCKVPPDKISYMFNMYLPPDIRVRHSEQVDDNFHARFDAKAKTYRYTIYNDRHAPAIWRHTTAFVRGPLDIERMRAAADKLCGTHDFKPFSGSGTEVKDTVRTIYSIKLAANRPYIYIDVTGSGFLNHMVRIIAGTLIAVGIGKREPTCIDAIFAGSELAGATAPAKGLTLKKVYYTPDEPWEV